MLPVCKPHPSRTGLLSTACLLCAFLGLLFLGAGPEARAQSPTITTYPFPAPAGTYPVAALIQASDGNFYGNTSDSSNGYGAIFRITAGGMLTTLHAFNGTDGANPLGALVQASDGMLYGTTESGGTAGYGTVFRISMSGVFTTLYSFSGHDDGYAPFSGLIQAHNGSLYGTTIGGGPNGHGTIYRITTAGTLTTVHGFNGADGAAALAGLVQASDGNLYGTASQGGANGYGTVFACTTTGNLTTLHDFNGTDGAYPEGALVQASDGNLYGTTSQGGPNGAAGGLGTIFRITTSGAFTTLYDFAGTDGDFPCGGLIQASDGNLYGTTENNGGGGAGFGTVFRITTAGSLTSLYTFSDGDDGASPCPGLVQGTDGSLYGVATNGGAYLLGTIYRVTTAGTLTTLYAFGGAEGAFPYDHDGLIQAGDGNIYGTTAIGGPSGYGTVFRLTPSGVLTTLHAFSGTDGGGAASAPIQGTDGGLYGTMWSGGDSNYGTVYSLTTGGAFTTLYLFHGSDGAYPAAPVVQASDGNLYGTTSNGGANSSGTIFRITTGGAFTTLYAFTGSADGSGPWAGLVQASDGNLYGTTSNGGAHGYGGTIFRITTAGTLTTLYSFTGGADGAGPETTLVEGSDGNLYGTTTGGGNYGGGTIFRITTGGAFTTLHAFTGSADGGQPWGNLIQASDGNLYGTTLYGGANNMGTIFRITTGGVLTTLYSFGGADGAYPFAGLLQATDGFLYGTTVSGGAGIGEVFRLAGSYPVPAIARNSPGSGDAGGPAFILTAKGASFQPFSTIHWNGSPLATTYVSATALKATVPASLVASPGKATITVVTGAGGGTSNKKTFTILLTTLKLTASNLTKNSTTGVYTAKVSFKNVGYITAPAVTIKSASLGGAATSTTLPVSLGALTAGSTASIPLTFPPSAGISGSTVTLKVAGTFISGKFSDSLKVTLP